MLLADNDALSTMDPSGYLDVVETAAPVGALLLSAAQSVRHRAANRIRTLLLEVSWLCMRRLAEILLLQLLLYLVCAPRFLAPLGVSIAPLHDGGVRVRWCRPAVSWGRSPRPSAGGAAVNGANAANTASGTAGTHQKPEEAEAEKAEEAKEEPKYEVQISHDGGAWQTVASGVVGHQLELNAESVPPSRMQRYTARVRAMSTGVVAAWSHPSSTSLPSVDQPFPWLYAVSTRSLVAQWLPALTCACVVTSYELLLTDEGVVDGGEVIGTPPPPLRVVFELSADDATPDGAHHRHRFEDLSPGHRYVLQMRAFARATAQHEQSNQAESTALDESHDADADDGGGSNTGGTSAARRILLSSSYSASAQGTKATLPTISAVKGAHAIEHVAPHDALVAAANELAGTGGAAVAAGGNGSFQTPCVEVRWQPPAVCECVLESYELRLAFEAATDSTADSEETNRTQEAGGDRDGNVASSASLSEALVVQLRGDATEYSFTQLPAGMLSEPPVLRSSITLVAIASAESRAMDGQTLTFFPKSAEVTVPCSRAVPTAIAFVAPPATPALEPAGVGLLRVGWVAPGASSVVLCHVRSFVVELYDEAMPSDAPPHVQLVDDANACSCTFDGLRRGAKCRARVKAIADVDQEDSTSDSMSSGGERASSSAAAAATATDAALSSRPALVHQRQRTIESAWSSFGAGTVPGCDHPPPPRARAIVTAAHTRSGRASGSGSGLVSGGSGGGSSGPRSGSGSQLALSIEWDAPRATGCTVERYELRVMQLSGRAVSRSLSHNFGLSFGGSFSRRVGIVGVGGSFSHRVGVMGEAFTDVVGASVSVLRREATSGSARVLRLWQRAGSAILTLGRMARQRSTRSLPIPSAATLGAQGSAPSSPTSRHPRQQQHQVSPPRLGGEREVFRRIVPATTTTLLVDSLPLGHRFACQVRAFASEPLSSWTAWSARNIQSEATLPGCEPPGQPSGELLTPTTLRCTWQRPVEYGCRVVEYSVVLCDARGTELAATAVAPSTPRRTGLTGAAATAMTSVRMRATAGVEIESLLLTDVPSTLPCYVKVLAIAEQLTPSNDGGGGDGGAVKARSGGVPLTLQSTWSELSDRLQPLLHPPALSASVDSPSSLCVRWEPPIRVAGTSTPRCELQLCDGYGAPLASVPPLLADAAASRYTFDQLPRVASGAFTVRARLIASSTSDTAAGGAEGGGGQQQQLASKTVDAIELRAESTWSAPCAKVRLPSIGRVEQLSVRPAFPALDRFRVEWKPPPASSIRDCELAGFAIEVVGAPPQAQAQMLASDTVPVRGAAAETAQRVIEVHDPSSAQLTVEDVEGGHLFQVRVRALAVIAAGGAITGGVAGSSAAGAGASATATAQLGRFHGEWSVSCQLLLPAIATLLAPTFVTLPGDKVHVRWRRPATIECELVSYELAWSTADDDNDAPLTTSGDESKSAWQGSTSSDISSSKPERLVPLKPQQRYVARVRAFGVAKDGKTRVRTGWSALSESFSLAKRMGGGFGLVQSAEVDLAMARARRRSSARASEACASARESSCHGAEASEVSSKATASPDRTMRPMWEDRRR